jgi:hypothetical protein
VRPSRNQIELRGFGKFDLCYAEDAEITQREVRLTSS